MKPTLLLTTLLGVIPLSAQAGHFSGDFVDGDGDEPTLDSINAAFESIRPSARMISLPLFYKRDWNGFVEGSSWPCWWTQNSFGATYGMQPFMGEEPYASWIANAQDLWFRLMGDGKRRDSSGDIAPDGSLMDGACFHLSGGTFNGFGDFRHGVGRSPIDGKVVDTGWWFKQGDSNRAVTDWFLGGAAAGLVMESDRLLVRHDPTAAKLRLTDLKRVAAFLDSRRDPETNLLKGGHNSNLLAPTFRGVRKADGTYERGYLTELSVNYVAGLERLAEVCLLCGEADQAAGYRDTALKVRRGLPRLMTPEGYFIKSEESDGRHGVFGAPQYGYFEAHPNHDAGAFRVIDDVSNKNIVDFMLHKVKGQQPPGSLIPHGFVLPNYPGYDDHSGEGAMSYGVWTNGGVWPAHEGVMGIACFRAGESAHPLAAWAAMRPLFEAFRADAPLGNWGTTPWEGQLAKPYCFCYDNMGPTGGILRGLFEYGYTAKGLRLWPHVPTSLTHYAQKVPASFGRAKIYLATTGSGVPDKALVNGQSVSLDADGSLFLPLDGSSKKIEVEFLSGNVKPRGVSTAAVATVVPPASDTAFWSPDPVLQCAPAASANQWPLRIGGSPAGGHQFLGQIKEVCVFRHAMSEEEVSCRAGRDKCEPINRLARWSLESAASDGTFPASAVTADANALCATRADNNAIKFQEGGLLFDEGSSLDVPSSSLVDFFENYSLEIRVRPVSLKGARLIDRSTPGAADGFMFDYLAGDNEGQTLRLITPWGIAQGKAKLKNNEWQHLAATCDDHGIMRIFVDGRKIAETKGAKPVPQPTVPRPVAGIGLAAAGAFLTAMENAGRGDSMEAGQARMVVDLLTAYRARKSPSAAHKLPIPDLFASHHIPPADQAKVDEIYRNTARWVFGGLQDHLRGVSLQKFPITPEVLQMAKDTGLLSKTGD